MVKELNISSRLSSKHWTFAQALGDRRIVFIFYLFLSKTMQLFLDDDYKSCAMFSHPNINSQLVSGSKNLCSLKKDAMMGYSG